LTTTSTEEAATEPVAEPEVLVEVIAEEPEAAVEAPAAPARQSSPAARPARRPAPVSQTTGRRKRAVARVRFRPGDGKITINKRPFEGYFTSATHRMIVSEPLRLSNAGEKYDIDATIDGGGISGQAGALRLGITRALVKLDPELRTTLKRAGLLTRDAREKESKKYGLKKARKAPQYSKR
jgi:small subunit ribosomal protein S9